MDDGAVSVDETIEMLRLAHEAGTREIVATPHMFLEPFGNTDPEAMGTFFGRTLADLAHREREHPFLEDLKIYTGSENYFSADFLEALQRKNLLSLNLTRYLLVELPPMLAEGPMEAALKGSWMPVSFPLWPTSSEAWWLRPVPMLWPPS